MTLQKSSPKKKILIVEDDEILAEFFANIFSHDFEVRNEFCGAEAIFASEEFVPDLIWLDILLGEHSAFAFLNELRSYADTAEIPVVICSSVVDGLRGANLGEYGVVRIFDKTKMVPQEILQCAREILNEKN